MQVLSIQANLWSGLVHRLHQCRQLDLVMTLFQKRPEVCSNALLNLYYWTTSCNLCNDCYVPLVE